TYVNDKFCEISKYSPDELLGKNHRILNSGLHSDEYFRELYQTISRGEVWHGELRNRTKHGNLYWVDTTIVPFLDDSGKPYQYTAIRYDITERKRSEAALRDQAALAQVGKMAAVVAHEVRNPLAGIRGALQVIGRRLDGQGPEKAIIEEVIARVDGLNDIVQDLLLFARPRQPLLAPLPVAELLAATVALVQQDPQFSGVTVTVASTDAVIAADADQLRQVLLNLLINSAQAMEGRGEIRVSVRAVNDGCEIRLHDNGPGIGQDVRDHLFAPFFTTKHRGTGLGLATARRILDAHHGTLKLECPASGGTAAVVWIPRESPPARSLLE
ncbi:MAG: PAS domain S-box protein, partial [Acidobacteria bacterium]|nr:PAS domain S-box protein [Acidobacteriota bacterium]